MHSGWRQSARFLPQHLQQRLVQDKYPVLAEGRGGEPSTTEALTSCQSGASRLLPARGPSARTGVPRREESQARERLGALPSPRLCGLFSPSLPFSLQTSVCLSVCLCPPPLSVSPLVSLRSPVSLSLSLPHTWRAEQDLGPQHQASRGMSLGGFSCQLGASTICQKAHRSVPPSPHRSRGNLLLPDGDSLQD